MVNVVAPLPAFTVSCPVLETTSAPLLIVPLPDVAKVMPPLAVILPPIVTFPPEVLVRLNDPLPRLIAAVDIALPALTVSEPTDEPRYNVCAGDVPIVTILVLP